MKNLKNYVFILCLILESGLHQNVAQAQDDSTTERKEGPQVIIITGTASGFGKATAEKLVAKGHIVYGGDINVEGNAYLNKIGGHSLEMDVTNDSQVRAGIERIISKRLNRQAVGYSASANTDQIDKDNLMQYIIPKDIKDFGLIPEIIGRLPVLSYMNPLDRETLRSILTEPKNALIKQYQKLFDMDGVEFSISEEALDYIVDKALEYKLGARGLRSLCEAILTDAMYDLPSSDEKSLHIEKSYAEHTLNKNMLQRLKAVS